MDKKQLANKVIDSLGGTCAVADLFDLTSGAVSQWRSSGIPKAWLRYITDRCEDLRPDVDWVFLRGGK